MSEITVLLVLNSEERHIEEWPGSLFIFGSALNISNLAMRGILKELVELIAKALVDDPDKVQVSQLDGEKSSIIELKVAQEDLGKVIGKQRRNAQAIRVIVSAAGMKLKKRFNLKIIEKG